MNFSPLKGHIPDSVFEQLPIVRDKFGINTPLRLIHFLAQCSHESGNFKAVTENLNYSSGGLRSIFSKYFPTNQLAKDYERNPQKIASRTYASRLGNSTEPTTEGWKYRGRGYIQLTGKSNYESFQKFVGEDLVSNPDLVSTKYPLASAGWFFLKTNLNPISDKGISIDIIKEVTKKINGGYNGLDHRISETNRFAKILGVVDGQVFPQPNGQSPSSFQDNQFVPSNLSNDNQQNSRGENESDQNVSNKNTFNPSFITVIEKPSIVLNPIEIDSDLSEEGNKEFVEGLGYLPLIWYIGYQISTDDIKSLTLFHDGILPKVRFTFIDSFNLMKTYGFPQDDTTFQFFLNSRSLNLKSIHLEFKVEKFQDNGKGIYTILGTLNVPNFYYLQFKSYSNKTSWEALLEISKQCELGFNSNMDNTDDKMTWINAGSSVKMFTDDIIRNSYKSEESFLIGFIDYFYSFNYVDVEKEFKRDISDDKMIETSGYGEQVIGSDDLRLVPLSLTNDPSVKASSRYFENIKVKNQSTSISLEEGYLTRTKFYDIQKKEMLQFDIDSITSEGDKSIILKGNQNDREFYNTHTNSKYVGKIDIDNSHKNFNYSLIQNDRNLVDLYKLSINADLTTPNFNLYRFQKVSFLFVNYNPNLSNTDELIYRLSGEWLIVDISFSFKDGAITQNIKAVKKELSMTPEEIENSPGIEKRNYFNSDNENPIDNINNFDNTQSSEFITDIPITPSEFDLDYVVGEDGKKISHGLLDNNKKTPILVVIDGQPIEEKTGIAFMQMKKAAEKEGIKISVNSGFRPAFGSNLKGKTMKGKNITITTQESIRRDKGRWVTSAYKAKDDNDFVFNAPASAFRPATAAPGKSNHGSGIALDLSTGSRVSFSRVLNEKVYTWLSKNSWKFGFIRAVNSEEWHFEYRPEIASKGPYSKVSNNENNLFYRDLGLDKLCAC
jgi:putative chitinase